MRVAVVILNYNDSDNTVHCIESIERHNSAPIKYIVVDNGSPDRMVVASLDSWFKSVFGRQYLLSEHPEGILPRMTFIPHSQNIGYASGNNIGLQAAFHDDEITHILIINNDILLTEDIIPTLLEKTQELDACGIVSPLLYRKDGVSLEYNCARISPSNQEVMLPFLFHNRDWFQILTKSSRRRQLLRTSPELTKVKSFAIELPSGSCMFVNKEIFKRLEGFDPRTFLYYEENILFKKTQAQGLINYCIPGISAIHLGGSSTSKTPNEFLQRCNAESADYYLRQYGKMSVAEKAEWSVIRWLYMLRLKIKALLVK